MSKQLSFMLSSILVLAFSIWGAGIGDLQAGHLSTDSSVDPHNTYQWNRKNALRGNGKVDEKPWFEWWYYKVVVPETKEAFYFVYGVVNPWDFGKTMGGTHSYVGAGDFTDKFIIEDKFGIEDFEASHHKTFVKIGEHLASNKKIIGNLSEAANQISWDIDIKKDWTFDAEGWGTATGITNIEWYPAQAGATCNGTVISNGRTIELKNAPCYQDRNWGISFPEWWSWIVSNKFKGHPDTVLAVGGGKPKFLNRFAPIEGVAVGLRHKGVEYAFRPNDLDDIDLNINFGTWEVTATNGRHKVEISAYAPPENFMDLQFTTPEGVIFHDWEALIGKVTVKLYKKHGFLIPRYELIDVLESDFAGIEYGSMDSQALNRLFQGQTQVFSTKEAKRRAIER